MELRLGDIAPEYTQESTEGTIRFHEWQGSHWGVMISQPKDFTPVCTTELGAVAKLKSEFDQRGVKVLALSVDPVPSHSEWIKDIDDTQNRRMYFSILADADR